MKTTLKEKEITLQVTWDLLSTFYSSSNSLLEFFALNPSQKEKEKEGKVGTTSFIEWLSSSRITWNHQLKPPLAYPQPAQHHYKVSEIIQQSQSLIFGAYEKYKLNTILKSGDWFPKSPPNVLTAGYESVRTITSSGMNFTSYAPNTTVYLLNQSSEWQTLLNLVGPDALVQLFSHPSVALFTLLPNACYLQVSGTPMANIRTKSTAMFKPEQSVTSGNNIKKRKFDQGQDQIDNDKRKKKHTRGKKKKKKNQVPTLNAIARDVSPVATLVEDDDDDVTALPIRPTKRPRLGQSKSLPQIVVVPVNTSVKSTLSRTKSSTFLAAPPPLRHSTSLTHLISTVPIKRSLTDMATTKKHKIRKLDTVVQPSDILFVRNKMFHARPGRTLKGKIRYGLSSTHVLSRLELLFVPPPPSPAPLEENPPLGPIGTLSLLEQKSRHLLKHVFPRQFGFENIFTVVPSPFSTGMVNGYEDRDQMIKDVGSVKTPVRLKSALRLAERMILLHAKCNHRQLLDRYCPSKITKRTRLTEQDKAFILDLFAEPNTQVSHADVSIEVTQPSLIIPHGQSDAQAKVEAKPKFGDYMCSPREVEGFVLQVVRRTIPREFWGSKANEELILSHVAQFLRFRRYESTSLHVLLQSFSIVDCDWLRPISSTLRKNYHQKPNAVEMGKRKELLMEFLFWFFDCFIIDLVKTSFSVTESASFRNRTVYFRQDDWTTLCKPLLLTLGSTMFTEIPPDELKRVISSRTRQLGISNVRLLPKETGVRPIINLKRRPTVKNRSGNMELGRSINSLLGHAFSVLNFEKNRHLDWIGASVMGSSEIYPHLKRFKQSIKIPGEPLPRLYFVKVDVKACFDTIKQDKLLEIVESLMSEKLYRVQKYTSVLPAAGKVTKKYPKLAFPAAEKWSFPEAAAKLAGDLRHAVFSDAVTPKIENRQALLTLIREHVTMNLVRIGNRYYRQKDGIPQGSVLSSLFCSLFYGEMEREELGFTSGEGCCLLRYIDDFLFITTKKPLAVRFLETMHQGLPEYGCYISSEKRLTNFDISLEGSPFVGAAHKKDFPWCGITIHTESLDVKADLDRYNDTEMPDTMTIERCRKPGEAFLFKMLQAMKVRSHIIYNDTSYNSAHSVYLNIYQSFLMVALKFRTYIREWKANPMIRATFFLRVIDQVVQFAYVAIRNRSKTRLAKSLGGQSKIQRTWVVWLGRHAFHHVLSRQGNLYYIILRALKRLMKTSGIRKGGKRRVQRSRTMMQAQLNKVIHCPGNRFADRM